MSAATRRIGSALLAIAAAAAVAGCETVRPGAAAVVGAERIPVAEVQQAVDRVLAAQPRGADAPDGEVARAQLTRLISARLLERTANDLGISASPGEIDARLDAYRQRFGGQRAFEEEAGRAGVAPADLPGFVRDLVIVEKIGDRLVRGAPITQVRAAHILVRDQPTAQRVLDAVRADPRSFAALARQNSLDTSNKDSGGDLGFQSPGRYVKPFADALATARPGQFLVVQTEFGWHVVHVIATRTLRPAQLVGGAAQQVLDDERNARVAQELREAAGALSVSVSPRYGRWDPQAVAVVPTDDALSRPTGGEEPPPSPTAGEEPPP